MRSLPLSLASFAVVALLYLLCTTTWMVQAADKKLSNPTWSTSCNAPFTHCSQVETYTDWRNRNDSQYFQMNGLSADPKRRDVVTVWFVQDQPDLTLAKTLYREGMNVFVFYPRGTQYASPAIECGEKVPVRSGDSCWLDETCAANLAKAGTAHVSNMSLYGFYHVAADLQRVMGVFGDGKKNVILTSGLSSGVVWAYLRRDPKSPAAVIATDYAHPDKFSMYSYLKGASTDMALQHLLNFCDDEVTCSARTGAGSGLWNRLVALLAAAKEGNLPCMSKLNWKADQLFGRTGSRTEAPIRQVLADLLQSPEYPFAGSGNPTLSLIPSVLYRLQRCHSRDVEALNFLFTHLAKTRRDGRNAATCPSESLAVHMHWLVNEYNNHSIPTESAQKVYERNEKSRVVLPSQHAHQRFLAAAQKYPKMAKLADEKGLPTTATQRILLIPADMDAVLPGGDAAAMAASFTRLGDTVALRPLRGVYHAPSSLLSTCLIKNLKFYGDRNEFAGPELCTTDPSLSAANVLIDFINVDATAYYGMNDAWEFTSPNAYDPGEGPSADPGDDDSTTTSTWRDKLWSVVCFLFWAAVVVMVAGLLVFGFQWLKSKGRLPYLRVSTVSDDFYENVNRASV